MDQARWGVEKVPREAETEVRLREGDRVVEMAYRAVVYPSNRPPSTGCVMIARR
jgi:hypothetical protein